MRARTLALGAVLACSPVSQDLGENDPRTTDAGTPPPDPVLPDSGGGASHPPVDAGQGDGSTPAEWADQGELPNAAWVHAIHGTGPADIWRVGGFFDLTNVGGGLRQHFDGTKWSDFSQCCTGELHSVWALSSTDVWAVGKKGRILHWNGSAWLSPPVNLTTAKDLYGVWGSSPNDLWIVGGDGGSEIFHFDGQKWTSKAGAYDEYKCIWGFGPKDIWVGGFKTILHYDGNAWTTSRDQLQTTVNAIWGTSTNDLWAVGNFGFVSHWDGSKWTEFPTGDSIAFESVFGFAPNNVYAVGSRLTISHYDGTRWTRDTKSRGTLSAIWGAAPNDIWTFGDGPGFRRRR